MNTLYKTLLILGLSAAAPTRGYADAITITFAEPVLNVVPGQQGIAVLATLTNTDLNNTVFLNSSGFSVPGAATVDDEFFVNVPFSLDPGQVSASIELFRFDVAPNASAGTLAGSYQLLGGVGTPNQFNFDALGAQTFTLNIQAVPEPSQCLLLGGGLIALSLAGRLRRRPRTA